MKKIDVAKEIASKSSVNNKEKAIERMMKWQKYNLEYGLICIYNGKISADHLVSVLTGMTNLNAAK